MSQSEEDARKLFELLFACDTDPNAPMLAQLTRDSRKIRISLRGGPPGTGKSYKLFQEWDSLGDYRKLYLSHSHKFLTEQANRLGKEPDVRHLFGLARICPCNTTHKNTLIQKLIQLRLPTKQICMVCQETNAYSRKDCLYQQQFKKIKKVPVVVAPVEYAFTKLLSKYKPDFIAVDDCLTRIQPHPTQSDLNYLLIYLVSQTKLPRSKTLVLTR